MSENGEIYTAGKNFTLPLALTAWTNSTSALLLPSKHLIVQRKEVIDSPNLSSHTRLFAKSGGS